MVLILTQAYLTKSNRIVKISCDSPFKEQIYESSLAFFTKAHATLRQEPLGKDLRERNTDVIVQSGPSLFQYVLRSADNYSMFSTVTLLRPPSLSWLLHSGQYKYNGRGEGVEQSCQLNWRLMPKFVWRSSRSSLYDVTVDKLEM